MDVSHVRPIPRRVRAVLRLPPIDRTLARETVVHRTMIHRTLARRTLVLLTPVRPIVVARLTVNGRTLFLHLTRGHDQLRHHQVQLPRPRVQLLVLSRDLMNDRDVLCDLQWVKARSAYAGSKESRTTHEARTTREASAPIHLNA